MSEEVKIKVELRKYLLGILDEEQTEKIEERLVSEEKYFQELQIVEAEIIQDFVDEKLNEQEKRAFDENFIITGERREQINFARALRKFVDEKPKSQTEKKSSFFDSLKSLLFSPIPATAAILLIVSLFALVWWNYPRQSEILVALNKSQKNERPTDARISDFDYAPKTEGTRGNEKTENLELISAKARATEAVLKNPTAENYHLLGQVYLAEKNFDESIKQFEKAIKLNPNIAKLNNDLGVALLEKGRQKDEGKLELYARANESIEKAIEQDKTLKEAYFNRALTIELLNLPNQAKEAWENYLKLDSTSKWADEAHQHLKKLEANKPISKTKEKVLQDFLEAKKANDTERAWQTLSRNREMITGKLIPQQLAFLFVDAKTEGNESKAKEYLDALIYAGKLEEEKSGDLFWRDIAQYYASVSDSKILQLKKARDLIEEGYELCKKSDFEKAKSVFVESELYFQKVANSLEAQISKHLIAYCSTQNDKIRESLKLRGEIEKFCSLKNYKWLGAINSYRKGSDLIVLAQYSQAETEYKKSLGISEKIKDEYATQRNLLELADVDSYFGQYTKSLNNLQKVFKLSNQTETSPRQNWRNLMSAIVILSSSKLNNTAQIFGKEAIEIADEMNDPIFMTNARLYYGQATIKSKKFDEGRIWLKESAEKANDILDDELRKNIIASSYLYLANLERMAGNFQISAKYYQDALSIYEKMQLSYNLYETQKGLMLSYTALKNDFEVEKQIPVLLKLANDNRKQILSEQKRNSFFDSEQDIYDIAADYEFNKANYEKAYNYSEESRSRSLLDLQNSSVEIEEKAEIKFLPNITQPLKLKEIQTEMSEDAQLLQYTILNDKVLIWVITKDNFAVEKTEILAEMLKEKVLIYLDLISKNREPSEQQKLSTELYQILIKPIREKLDTSKDVFIIPDKVLFRLPFATLLSVKYLIEDFKIAYAPSANVFLFCSKKAKELDATTPETLLSIGNPSFNQSSFQDLPTLPSAKQEAQKITENYDNSIVFTEKEATKTVIKENLNKADVIHFAGHYVIDEYSPLFSGLVLTGNDKEDSILANYEIIAEKLSHTRLIILSACQTGGEEYFNGEGMIGASRAFLATGVPSVVASQWQVDSEATAKLMTDFHHYRKIEKLSTAEALRQAQLEMLRNEKYQKPYYWAAFIKLGGFTKF